MWLFGRSSSAVNVRPYAKRLEVVGRCDRREGSACRVAFGDAHERQRVRHDVAEHLPVVANVLERRIGERPVGVGLGAVVAVEAEHLARAAAGQRLQQHGVDQAEDRGVGPDTKRQDEHRDTRKPGVLQKDTQRVPKILEQAGHGLSSSVT
jgi:hypothetical protein